MTNFKVKDLIKIYTINMLILKKEEFNVASFATLILKCFICKR